MTGEEFAVAIHNEFIEKSLERYREHLRTASRDIGTTMPWGPPNPWGLAIRAWDTTGNEQRDAFLQFVRMAMVETASNIFCVLDGSATLPASSTTANRDRFILLYGPYNQELSKRPDRLEDITDYFLVAEQEKTHSLWPDSSDEPPKPESKPKKKPKKRAR